MSEPDPKWMRQDDGRQHRMANLEAEIDRLRAELAEMTARALRAELTRWNGERAEAKLARVLELPTMFTDRWIKFDDVLRAIEEKQP